MCLSVFRPRHHVKLDADVPLDVDTKDIARLLGFLPDASAFLYFTSSSSKKPSMTPVQAEFFFLTVPSNDSAHARSVILTTMPHMAGSEGDLITALNTLSHFQSAFGLVPPADPPIYDTGSEESRAATLGVSKWGGGLNAWIDKYYPVMNTAVSHSLSVIAANGSVIWEVPLEEIDYSLPSENNNATDPAGIFAHAVPAFHGLSKNGSGTGHLLNAGKGSPEEFAALREKGIKTEGCVSLVSYGGVVRGLKIKASEEAGCVATLIWSDPADDGSVQSPTYAPYPDGPARQPISIQHGSVQYISLYVGDPITPGEPAYPNATRLESGNVPSIPSLPLSAGNAAKLLELVGEDEGRTVRVVNEVNTRIMPIWNVMAVIPGHIADEVVVLGNHRDGTYRRCRPDIWVGNVHEIIEGFTALMKEGWKPLRTILFASWDAEELPGFSLSCRDHTEVYHQYGLMESVEWGEDFEEWIKEHVVAYLNIDSSASGSRLHLGGSPSLAHLIRGAAQSVPHPTDPDRTLWDARSDTGPFTGTGEFQISAAEARKFRDERIAWVDEEEEIRVGMLAQAQTNAEASIMVDLGVNALGSGSDYTVFLERIGVASLDGGFSATTSDGVYHYHSVHDSVHWMEEYGDPGYHRHAASAEYLGIATLRMVDSIILPLNTTHYAYELDYYLQKVEDIVSSFNVSVPSFSALREAIMSLQAASLQLDEEKVTAEKELLKQLKKFRHGHGICAKRSFQRLCTWIKALFGVRKDSESAQSQPHSRVPSKLNKAAKRVRAVNKQLSLFERNFISAEGLRGREWYRNVLVAPGLWLGYGATTFPGLTEAFTIDANATLAELETQRLTHHILNAAIALKVKMTGCEKMTN